MPSSKIDIKNLILSIIIPVYNEKETINDIIESAIVPYLGTPIPKRDNYC